MYWYWWVWIGIVVFLVLLPLGYGWGYRQWGPPYPRYYNRRRRVTAPVAEREKEPVGNRGPRRTFEVVERIEEQPVLEEPEPAPTGGWGLLADLLWLAVLGAAIWAIVAFSWG